MNEIQIFKYNQNEIRTIEKEGEPWWIAKDICEVFGETNRNRAMQSLDEDEKGYTRLNTPGGLQKLAIINEAGLYSLLFAMQPKKARGVSDEYIADRQESLKRFKRWVTHEVLPSIRKHGAHAVDQLLDNPDLAIKAFTALKEERDARKKLETENALQRQIIGELQPKAEYFDELVDQNLLTNFRETAKQLHVPERKFIKFLLDKKYIYRDKKGKLSPVAQFAKSGLFEVKEHINEKNHWSGTQTLITPKGRETFRLLFLKVTA